MDWGHGFCIFWKVGCSLVWVLHVAQWVRLKCYQERSERMASFKFIIATVDCTIKIKYIYILNFINSDWLTVVGAFPQFQTSV